jgi:orotate phosphoribosyltransferase-like protein
MEAVQERAENQRRRLARQLKTNGATYQEIGEQLGVSRQRAQQLVRLGDKERERFLSTNPTCHFCRTTSNGRKLDVAHITYESGNTRMIPLCIECHRKLDTIIGLVIESMTSGNRTETASP